MTTKDEIYLKQSSDFDQMISTMINILTWNVDHRKDQIAKSDHDLLSHTTSSMVYLHSIYLREWRFSLSERAQTFFQLCDNILSQEHKTIIKSIIQPEDLDKRPIILSIGSCEILFHEITKLIIYGLTSFDASKYGNPSFSLTRLLKNFNPLVLVKQPHTHGFSDRIRSESSDSENEKRDPTLSTDIPMFFTRQRN